MSFNADHVFQALEFADKNSDRQYNENTVVHNPQVIRDVVKICGCRFKIVPPPDQEIETEEVQFVLISFLNLVFNKV